MSWDWIYANVNDEVEQLDQGLTEDSSARNPFTHSHNQFEVEEQRNAPRGASNRLQTTFQASSINGRGIAHAPTCSDAAAQGIMIPRGASENTTFPHRKERRGILSSFRSKRASDEENWAIKDYESALKTMERQKKTAEVENQDLRTYVHKIEKQLTNYEREVEQLKAELDEERSRIRRIQHSADQMQTMMDNKELFLGFQENDDQRIRVMFASIIADITTWSLDFNGGSGNPFEEEHLRQYQFIAPLYSLKALRQLSATSKEKRLFVRGWTAYIMSNMLFRSFDESGTRGKDVWLKDDVARGFACLEDELWGTDRILIPHRALNDWRAHTADLLSKCQTSDDEYWTGQNVEQAIDQVRQVVGNWCTGDQVVLQACEDRLRTIFFEAVHLARFFRRQRALWSVRFPSSSTPVGFEEEDLLMFDPTGMKDDRGDDEYMTEDELRQQNVKFILAPTLYKRGTANGEMFESETVAVKAVVTMSADFNI